MHSKEDVYPVQGSHEMVERSSLQNFTIRHYIHANKLFGSRKTFLSSNYSRKSVEFAKCY